MARKGLAQANTLRSNNTASTGYGAVYADEVSGHKSVADLTALYALHDWQLSISGNNTDNDAIGQLWYVVDADGSGNGCFYQLKDWSNRNTGAGWTKFTTSSESGTTITIDSELSTTSTNPVQNKAIAAPLNNKVDKVDGKGLSTNDYTDSDKEKLDTIVSQDINLAQIDTCGYSNITTLITTAIAAKREMVFNVTDINSKLHVYVDPLKHALYQKLETCCTLDSNYNLINSHKDGITYVYYRAYLNGPVNMYSNNTGYTSSSTEWSPWIIADTLGIANKSTVQACNMIMSMYGRMLFAQVTTKDDTKLVFDTLHMGGSSLDAFNVKETEIPEATTTCNGLLSAADKVKLNALGDDFAGFAVLSTDEIDTLWTEASAS